MNDQKDKATPSIIDNGSQNNGNNSNGANGGTGTTPFSTSAGRDVPLLGMLLDRTSFDQADDFGVNEQELKNKNVITNAFLVPPPTLMKNGKVRRRLRWRPRSPKKPPHAPTQPVPQRKHKQQQQIERLHQSLNQRQPQQPEQNQEKPQQQDNEPQQQQNQQQSRGRTLHQSLPKQSSVNRVPWNLPGYTAARNTGSGCSVVSSSTRQSKKSVHSFASTETAAVSNKKKDLVKKFVIRRPNYFPPNPSLCNDASPDNVISNDNDDDKEGKSSSQSDVSSQSEDESSDVSKQETRASPAAVGCIPLLAAPFAIAAAASSDSNKSQRRKSEVGNDEESCETASTTSTGSLPLAPRRSNSSTGKDKASQRDSRSLPPILKRIQDRKSKTLDSDESIACRKDSPIIISGLSMCTSLIVNAKQTTSRSRTSSTSDMASTRSTPNPVLFDNEVEDDRRVDLRIAPSSSTLISRESDKSYTRSKRSGKLMIAGDTQLIQELRSFASSTHHNERRPNDDASSAISSSGEENSLHNIDDDEGDDGSDFDSRDDAPSYEERDSSSIHPKPQQKVIRTASNISNSIALIQTAVSESFVTMSAKNINDKSRFNLISTKKCSSFSEEIKKLPVTQSSRARVSNSNENDENATQPTQELRFSMSSVRPNSTIVPVREPVTEEPTTDTDAASLMGPAAVEAMKSAVTLAITLADMADAASNPSPAGDDNSIKHDTKHHEKVSTGTPVSEINNDVGFLEAEKNLQAIQEVATEHLQQGEYAEALEVFQEILRGLLTRYGEEHYRVGTAVHNIGVVHMQRGDYNKALVAYKEAVRVRKLVLEQDHPDIAVSLAQLGMAYLESNKHQRAIGAFRESLKIRRKCFGNYHPKVAKVLNNIGCALYELDELDVARVAFEEALDIQRRILATSLGEFEKSTNDATLLSIASTQSNIASIKLYFGEFDAAVVDLEEALLMQQSVLGDDHAVSCRTQESLVWLENQRLQQHQIASTYNNAANMVIIDSLGKSGSNGKRGQEEQHRDARARTREILNKLTRTTSPSPSPVPDEALITEGATTSEPTALMTDQESSNGVFGSLERRFRKSLADLDYMSCGGG